MSKGVQEGRDHLHDKCSRKFPAYSTSTIALKRSILRPSVNPVKFVSTVRDVVVLGGVTDAQGSSVPLTVLSTPDRTLWKPLIFKESRNDQHLHSRQKGTRLSIRDDHKILIARNCRTTINFLFYLWIYQGSRQ